MPRKWDTLNLKGWIKNILGKGSAIMGRKDANYQTVRSLMKPGDVIAFSGKGDASDIIKWATRSSVSHVGVILQSKMVIDNEPQEGFFNQIIESISLNGFSGVSISRLSDRFVNCEGEIWWLPLGKDIRAKMNFETFYNFLLHQEHKLYDLPQALRAGLDRCDKLPFLNHLTCNTEDFTKFFCSELVAAALEECGCLSHLNASEVTPIDLCMFNIYDTDYYQLKGDAKSIKGFNSLDPADWACESL